MNLTRLNPLTLAEKITGHPMAAGTRHYFKDSIFYTAANFLPRLLGLLMTPIVTKNIATGDYNTVNVFNSALVPICIILSMQVENSVARYYYEDKKDFPDFLGTQFFFTLTFSVIMFLQFWIFRDAWANVFALHGSAKFFGWRISIMMLTVVAAMVQIVHQVYLQLLLARKQSRSYCLWNLAKQIIYVICGITLIYTMAPQNRYIGLIWASLIATVVLAIPFLAGILRTLRLVFRWEYVRYALHFSLPGIPGVLAMFLLNFFDRILFEHHNRNLGGQYTFAYNIGLLILMVTTGLFSAYMPRFYENMNAGRGEDNQAIFTRNFKLLLLGALGLILVSKPVALLLGRDPSYYGGLPSIPITVTGYLFMFLGQCFGLYIAFRRKFIFLQSVTLLIAAAINVYFNIWLQPVFLGRPQILMRVVAAITMVSYLVQWVLIFLVARILLKEKTVSFKGITWPFAGYLAFATAWSLFGYGTAWLHDLLR